MTQRPTVERFIDAGLDPSTAAAVIECANRLLSSLPPEPSWLKLTQEVLKPDHPFEIHRLLHEIVFSDWDHSQGPPPAWVPSEDQVNHSNIAEILELQGLKTYEELRAWSSRDRGGFWEFMTSRLGIRLKARFNKILDLSDGIESPRWLVGAKLNIADSCFNAEGDAPAIVFQEEGGTPSILSYSELDILTNRVANSLRDEGFNPGDRIAIDMPMTMECVAIYLGLIKAGCVAVSIADSFAPHEIEMRLRLSRAKGIFTQDFIPRSGKRLPMYGKVVSAKAPRAIVVFSQEDSSDPHRERIQIREGDMTWDQFLGSRDRFQSESRVPSDQINILFSSGTTGEPKAIPWTQTAPIKCASDGHLHQDIHPGDVVAWPTNLGWMMGPWLIYASLLNRATIALYYGVPTGRGFGRFVQDARVNMLGVVPSLVRVWRETECMVGLDWSSIRAFSSTGESSNPEDMMYLMSLAGYRPVIEYCGGTEISGGYITGTVVEAMAPATFTTPTLGLDFTILDEEDHPADSGELFLIPPSIGFSTELLNRDHHEVYYEGVPEFSDEKDDTKKGVKANTKLRRHGDQMERLGKGIYRALGRADDTMNLGGIKVSSAEIEQILNFVKGVGETAAIAVSPPEGGPGRLVIYAVVLPGVGTEGLKARLQVAIKEELNPLFKIHDLVIVDSLVRTASNKVMRRVLRVEYGKRQTEDR